MQVGSSSISTQSLLVDARRAPAGQPRPAAAVGEPPERAPREIARPRAREPVPAPATEQWQTLSRHSRTALQSYLSNGPTLAERFGVELAGVDLFV